MDLHKRLRMGGAIVLGDAGPHVQLVAANNPRELARVSLWPRAATYIGIIDETSVVVGATGGLQQRMRNQNWRNRGVPQAVLAFVTRPGAPPLTRDDALALERIVAHALSERVHVDTDLGLPHGSPRGAQRYAQLQAVWSASLPTLREVSPRLACTWPGAPALCRTEIPDCANKPLSVLRCCGVHAQVLRVAHDRYIVLAGSVIRRRLVDTSKACSVVAREELAFCGALLPIDDESWLLTRDVELPSLGDCTDFVVTHRSPHRQWTRLRRVHGSLEL